MRSVFTLPSPDSGILHKDPTRTIDVRLFLLLRDPAKTNQIQIAPRAAYLEDTRSAVLSGRVAASSTAAGSGPGRSQAPDNPQLAERLKRLDFDKTSQHASFGELISRPEKLDNHKPKQMKATGAARVAQSASLSQSLVQALHSADDKLLENCLQNRDTGVIRTTVKRVPNDLVVKLVNALVERLSRKRVGYKPGTGGVDAHRGQELIFWLRNVLIYHLPYLVTVSSFSDLKKLRRASLTCYILQLPELAGQLTSLHAMLDARMAIYRQLLALNGRLDLVVAQIEIRGGARGSGMADGFSGPKKYEEGEEASDSDDLNEVAVADEGDNREDNVEDLMLEAESEDDNEVEAPVGLNGHGKSMVNGAEASDEEILRPMQRKPAVGLEPKINGFLDLEAEESEEEEEDDDDDDLEAALRQSMPNGLQAHGESEEESEEDDDEYESDFINDASEESGADEDESDA